VIAGDALAVELDLSLVYIDGVEGESDGGVALHAGNIADEFLRGVECVGRALLVLERAFVFVGELLARLKAVALLRLILELVVVRFGAADLFDYPTDAGVEDADIALRRHPDHLLSGAGILIK